ncbi:branched-chain amino acid ABC transporter permease [Xanthobacter dioxanivorans]|uniref:Branched-chain amino acid ABC transporter permease n=1 Tax=Xanthobacter dioxanivorans TaxID=2528964 RepID=A0A974PNP2_9HYPH|nr:branched-chain amino acid ABC transporter permease [Xanthobacter dioxanivorans]QRG06944.1 branched-chain amino acid ABC transporter permease [Xanthobacter dioxanivorans]
MTAALFVQALFAGLTNGFVYALVGLGIAVIFKGSRTVNVVQGEFVVIGALVVVGLLDAAGLPYPVAALAGIVGGLLLGSFTEVAFIRPLIRRRAGEDALLLVSIGLAVAMSAAVLYVAGRGSYLLPAVGGNAVVNLAGATVRVHALFLIASGAALVLGLAWFFRHTMLGLSMMAAAMEPDGATVTGIDTERMRTLTFALGGALGAAAGILVAPLTEVNYQMGLALTLKGFAAAVLGGLANPLGAVAGGILIAMVEAFGIVFIASGYKNVFAMSVLILVMVLLPNGLLGRRARAGG